MKLERTEIKRISSEETKLCYLIKLEGNKAKKTFVLRCNTKQNNICLFLKSTRFNILLNHFKLNFSVSDRIHSFSGNEKLCFVIKHKKSVILVVVLALILLQFLKVS